MRKTLFLNPPSFEGYDGGSWVSLTTSVGGNTLDQAYDEGGAGAGRTIVADSSTIPSHCVVDGTVSNTDQPMRIAVNGNASSANVALEAGVVVRPR